MGFGGGPGESDLNPGGEDTIDIDREPEGGSFVSLYHNWCKFIKRFLAWSKRKAKHQGFQAMHASEMVYVQGSNQYTF